MQLSADDPTVKSAVFGVQVQNFLDSDVGAYLVRRAEDQANSALEELAEVSPEDASKIREIQNRIKVADSIISWLREAIQVGDQAVRHLREDG